jgi:hypothetical protein
MSAAKYNHSSQYSQQEKIQAAAAKLLQMLHSGQFPEIAKRSILLKSYGNSPCNKWSIGNIITILLAGTTFGSRSKSGAK